MSKKANFIKLSDSILNQIDYEDNYEFLILLNICKHLNAIYTAWGEKSFSTTPSVLLDQVAEQTEITKKIQQAILNSLQNLVNKKIIEIKGEKITWTSKIRIDGKSLINKMNNARPSETTFVTIEDLRFLMSQPFKKQNDLVKTYLYISTRINIANVQSLVEHQGEFTLYDFEQNDNFNFTFVSDTIDYMRCRKNYRIECDYNWIGKKQLSYTIKELCDMGMIKCITRTVANGSNKGLVTKRNFYYLPCIEDWKMEKVIDRYVARKNWIEINKHTPQS